MTATDTIAIRAPEDRFHTDLGWLDSWHSFSFGRHYDPSEVGFGLLLVNNDDIVAPGGGFPAHFHRDMEIVTWVLSGALAHRDSTGTDGIIRPGLAQRMSAGSGITHSEMNASSTEPVHFVQMWVLPDTNGIEPGYEQRDLTDRLEAGGLVPVASGQGHEGAVHIHQRDAVLWVARLADGQTVEVPDGGHVHMFVAKGSADLAGSDMDRGAAARLTAAGPLDLTGGPDGAEVLIWVTA
ncbi:MAG: pirin family protein [Acidimicrobiales bacterium]